MGAAVHPVLWHLRFSHFNEKGRWALDFKGVPHERRSLAPGAHPRRSRRLGGTGTTPILIIDGNTVADTTGIIAVLEDRYPEPPLYPSHDGERRRALQLEEQFDEELGPALRSAIFHAILPDRKLTVALTAQGLGRGTRLGFSLGYPMIRRLATRGLPADEAAAKLGRAKTLEALDLIEAELAGGDYLVGSAFSVADLTAAALLFPLTCPPEFPYELPERWPAEWEGFRGSLERRPGYQWAREIYRRHRGRSAEVAAASRA